MIVISDRRWQRFLMTLPSSPFKLLLLVTAGIAGASAWSGDPVVVGLIAILTSLAAMAANAIADEVTGVARNWRPQWSLRGMLAVVPFIALILACVFHQAPFQARFVMARNSLNSLAERVARGEPVELPCWAGTFCVREIETFPRRNGARSSALVLCQSSIDEYRRVGQAAHRPRGPTSAQWWARARKLACPTLRIRPVQPLRIHRLMTDRALGHNAVRRVYLWTDLDPVGRTGFAYGIEANNDRYWTQRRLDQHLWLVVED